MSAAPPRPGAKTLERRQAARIVASRLAELGRPRDLIEDEGVGALLEESHGSADRLRALLTTTLFLASTEDAPRIGPDHVHRAAASLPLEATPGPLGEAGPERRWGVVLAAPVTLAVVLAVVLLRPREAAHPPTRPPPPAVTALPKATPVAIVPPAAPPALPKPPAPPPDAGLPDAPPTSVVIYASPADPGAAAQLPPILQRLKALGLEPRLATAPGDRAPGLSVGFFYEEDKATAQRIAAAVGPGIVPIRLNNLSDSTTVRAPGTIQIIIPPSRPEPQP